ncbi:MAG: glycosyltransferase family 2 protein [Spirochaetes bacterium]|uniref:Glycosyltransferase family 2 protein n=1 Tax=Candidatus Gallitreponema excrementavium TaxID=2840840 RepID=A0A9D9HMP1_9SPIR|nr:glycosyltransferase family 2 protein [Candidatus Gallitreponema excrementavium]
MNVSIIIVNYNTKDVIRKCLDSIYEHTHDIDFEVIVSDNGSTDGSIEMLKADYPQVILIENNANLGFGVANNRGLDVAKGKYIFYLNSDTIILNNAVKMFFDYWEKSPEKDQIGALGGVLLNENLEMMHSGAPFHSYKSFCKIQMKQMIFHTIKSILLFFNLSFLYERHRKKVPSKIFVKTGDTDGYITGADLFVLNNFYARFDENFFMYCEETDLELRLKENGLKRIIIDGPKIQHLHKTFLGDKNITSFSEICTQISSIYYAKKNFKKSALILRFIIWLDWLNPYVRKQAKKVYTVYYKNQSKIIN